MCTGKIKACNQKQPNNNTRFCYQIYLDLCFRSSKENYVKYSEMFGKPYILCCIIHYIIQSSFKGVADIECDVLCYPIL